MVDERGLLCFISISKLATEITESTENGGREEFKRTLFSAPEGVKTQRTQRRTKRRDLRKY